MRRVQIATVGRSHEAVIEGFRSETVDNLVLLYSEKTLPQVDLIRSKLKELMGRDVCDPVLIDPFDLNDIVSKIAAAVKEYRGAEITINMTSGTNVMASAALAAGVILGARVIYVKEGVAKDAPLGERVLDVPVPRVPIDGLSSHQRAILRLMRAQKGAFKPANAIIATRLDVSAQLVSYHLGQLIEKGLIELETEGQAKEARLTPTGRLYAAIL